MTGSKLARGFAIVLGLAALAAIPAGAAVAQQSASIGLVRALVFAVPIAAVAALLGLLAARRARLAAVRSVNRDGAGAARAGRLLSWAGLYVAFIGAISLAVYAVLHLRK
jgi:hypothetical protein